MRRSTENDCSPLALVRAGIQANIFTYSVVFQLISTESKQFNPSRERTGFWKKKNRHFFFSLHRRFVLWFLRRGRPKKKVNTAVPTVPPTDHSRFYGQSCARKPVDIFAARPGGHRGGRLNSETATLALPRHGLSANRTFIYGSPTGSSSWGLAGGRAPFPAVWRTTTARTEWGRTGPLPTRGYA